MKLAGMIGTGILSLTLGATALAYPQQEQHDQQEENKDRPAQEREKKAQPEQSAKPDEKNARQEEKKSARPEEKNGQEQHAQQSRPEQKEEHAGGGRIPADRYKASFGREHSFRVSENDYRNHRFQYGGYWFGFQSVWPRNWLYTQDVYVVEINGVYYLCNASYPGVNLMLDVTL